MTLPRRSDSRGPGPAGSPGIPAPGRPLRIGITGPIGCGKSTVAGWLGELGASVIDADQVAREVTPPGSDALAAVVRAFGVDVLRADGSLDRAALGRIVFADPAALARLESIIHPAVRPRILELIERAEAFEVAEGDVVGAAAAEAHAAAAEPVEPVEPAEPVEPVEPAEPALPPAIVIEAIKLVEGGLAALCDEVWLVTCDPAAQRERLAARGAAAGRPSDRADTEARIAAQSGLVARLTPSATRLIDTSGSLAESRSRVDAAWQAALVARAQART